MEVLGTTSEYSFLPIAAELSLSSVIYLILLVKSTPKHNLTLSIAYSSIKLLAISSLFTTNLNIFGIVRLPFLLGLLLNEVVLLIWAIRNQTSVNSITIRSMYPTKIISLRVLGELLTVGILLSIAVGSLIIECDCNKGDEEFLGVTFTICQPPSAFKTFSNIISPQIRGLTFVIATTAAVVSVSGWKYLLMGFSNDITGKTRDNLHAILSDSPWKRMIRSVYAFLAVFTNGLFLFSFYMPGLAECFNTNIGESTDDENFRYSMGPVSNSVLNAMLAISQMFVADVQLRLQAFEVAELEETDRAHQDLEMTVDSDMFKGSGNESNNFMIRSNSVLRARASHRESTISLPEEADNFHR